MAQDDDLERDCSIKAFLSGTVNNALTATSNFLLQLIIAKMRRDAQGWGFAIFLHKPAEAGLEQTNAAKSAGRVGENCSSAFWADSWSAYHFSPLSIFPYQLVLSENCAHVTFAEQK